MALSDIGFTIKITPALALYTLPEHDHLPYRVIDDATGSVIAEGRAALDAANPGDVEISGIKIGESGGYDLTVYFGNYSQSVGVQVVPALLSLLPPLLAIIMALLTRQVDGRSGTEGRKAAGRSFRGRNDRRR